MKRTKAERQAAMKKPPASEGVAERIEQSLKAKATAPPPPMRPAPAIGMVWSAANGGGRRRYIAIVDREPGAVLSHEVTEAGLRVTDATAKREPFRTALEGGDTMPSAYRYEPTITPSNTLAEPSPNSAPEAQESTMSANPKPAVVAAAKKLTSSKKAHSLKVVPAAPAKKAAPAPKATAKKVASPKAAPKAHRAAVADKEIDGLVKGVLAKHPTFGRSKVIAALRASGHGLGRSQGELISKAVAKHSK